MEIKLDKLEETILESLKEQTGKSAEDIIKLALYELDRKMMQDKIQRAQESQPNIPVYPDSPQNPYPMYPIYPTYPYPWDTSPWRPYDYDPYRPYITWASSKFIIRPNTVTYGDTTGTYGDTTGTYADTGKCSDTSVTFFDAN